MGFVPELDRLHNWKIYLFRIEYVKPLRAVLKYLAGLNFLVFLFPSLTGKIPHVGLFIPKWTDQEEISLQWIHFFFFFS